VRNVNTSGERPITLTTDSVNVSAYGFRLNFQDERVASAFSNRFSFSEANAFKCVAFFQNKDTITSIDVITRFDFDNTHLGGSSVMEYLQARPSDFYNYLPQYQYKPLQGILHYLNESQDNHIHNNSIDIKFETLPSKLGYHRFVISVLFKSGRVLTDSTSITLQ
jgi:hypothetical protein